jgi:hypothetical protein
MRWQHGLKKYCRGKMYKAPGLLSILSGGHLCNLCIVRFIRNLLMISRLLTTGFILTLIQGQFVYSQTHKPAYAGREEYIEVEKMSNFMSLTLAKGACGTYSRMTATTQSIMAPGDPDLRPQLTKIKMPVAIFHGVKDKLCDFAQAAQRD